MMEKKVAFDLSQLDWEAWVIANGYPKFRASQIYSWFIKGVQDTARMQNIPAPIRAKIDESFHVMCLNLQNTMISAKDQTQKFAFTLWDGHMIETVLMKYKTGYSLCISSQAGCRMGCNFCASAHAGFGRNLTAGEMLAQILVVSDIISDKIRSVVVMGIGEPFDNYDELIAFLMAANAPEGLNLGARHITVSTCGLVPQMLKFMCIDLQVNLSVSLHASNDEQRRLLMPIANTYDMESLLMACKKYTDETNRRITFEYSLFDGVNDSVQDARNLAARLRGIHCHINLIAANEFDGSPYKRSKSLHVQQFKQTLEDLGMIVTLRREMGTDIMAACGQLRRKMQESGKS